MVGIGVFLVGMSTGVSCSDSRRRDSGWHCNRRVLEHDIHPVMWNRRGPPSGRAAPATVAQRRRFGAMELRRAPTARCVATSATTPRRRSDDSMPIASLPSSGCLSDVSGSACLVLRVV